MKKCTRFVISYGTDSIEVQNLCDADKRLALLIGRFGALEYRLHSDAFPFLVETIIGQMLSSKAADAITTRFYGLCKHSFSPSEIIGLEHSALKSIGLSERKADYINSLDSFTYNNPSFFEELFYLEDEEVIKHLTSFRGIGSWSAKMYLIFVLNLLDVLPFEDGAFLQAYKWLYSEDDVKPSSIIEKCQSWRPYSSIAARYLYRALDSGLTRDDVLRDELIRLSR